MNEALHERVRRIEKRALIRAWRYQKRTSSGGAWYRLRRVLVDAAEVWIIDEHDADRLEQGGHAPLGVGRELAPPKRMFFVGAEELRATPSRRRVAVRRSTDVVLASSLALVVHPGLTNRGEASVRNRQPTA